MPQRTKSAQKLKLVVQKRSKRKDGEPRWPTSPPRCRKWMQDTIELSQKSLTEFRFFATQSTLKAIGLAHLLLQNLKNLACFWPGPSTFAVRWRMQRAGLL